MKKNLILTSIIAMVFVCPAIAAPSNTSSTFPANGKMLEDYAYTGQATYTNMHSYTGPVTADATYGDCPSGYPHTDAGATSADECWVACTAADTGVSHANAATGKNFYGSGITDTCEATGCETGYHLNPGLNLTEIIGMTEDATAHGSINHSGTYSNGRGSTSQATYGITAPDTFGVDYGSTKGRITGKALCSTQVGYTDTVNNNNSNINNPTTKATMTPEFGTEGAQYCYCTIDSYTSPSGVSQSVSAPWVSSGDRNSAENCASSCAANCAGSLDTHYASAFRAALFNSITASCEANEISITWADASAEDIAANDAGSVTYGGDIRTPKKAVHKPGKIFTGWTFNTPSGN